MPSRERRLRKQLASSSFSPWFFYYHQNSNLHVVIQEKEKERKKPRVLILFEVCPEGLSLHLQ